MQLIHESHAFVQITDQPRSVTPLLDYIYKDCAEPNVFTVIKIAKILILMVIHRQLL